VIAPGLPVLAQFNPSSVGGAGQATGQGKSDTSNRMGGGGGTGKGATARTTTVKSSKSNTSDRMGGGGGKGGAKRSKNLNSGRSN
jgi:hypothetical protein